MVLSTTDVPRPYLEPFYVPPPEYHQKQFLKSPPISPSQRVPPPDSSHKEIDGVLKTREHAKHFARFISSTNVVSSDPWYLWEKGYTKLWIKDREGNKTEVKGDYDEPGIHIMEFDKLPEEVRNRLEIADKLEWLSHPLSGYLLKVLCNAYELGRVWGSGVLERCVKPHNGHYYRLGYGVPHGFVGPDRIANIRESADLFWGPEQILSEEILTRGERPHIPPSVMMLKGMLLHMLSTRTS